MQPDHLPLLRVFFQRGSIPGHPPPLRVFFQLCLIPLPLLLTGISSCETTDADGDGWSVDQGDCDDGDAGAYPGAAEVCDYKDNNCDGQVDEGLTTTWYIDHDLDGHGDPAGSMASCSPPYSGYVLDGDDCDDAAAYSYPGAAERCDGQDNDCDGALDDGTDIPWYPDADGDLYGVSSGIITGNCEQPAGFAPRSGDCNDSAADVHPGALELCDKVDSDCDRALDDGTSRTFYRDKDGDGFGIDTDTLSACAQPRGYAGGRGDCDDGAPDVHPGAPDRSNDGIDADCGGSDAAEPHAGYPGSLYTDLQAALDAVPQVSSVPLTVWIGPGIYAGHDLTFRGRVLTLAASHPEGQTLIDALGISRPVTFDTGEGPDSVLDGFQLTGGVAARGGGVSMRGSSPTLRGCIITGNQTLDSAPYGGGLYVEGGRRPCPAVPSRPTGPGR
jgi:hypothetical protein